MTLLQTSTRVTTVSATPEHHGECPQDSRAGRISHTVGTPSNSLATRTPWARPGDPVLRLSGNRPNKFHPRRVRNSMERIPSAPAPGAEAPQSRSVSGSRPGRVSSLSEGGDSPPPCANRRSHRTGPYFPERDKLAERQKVGTSESKPSIQAPSVHLGLGQLRPQDGTSPRRSPSERKSSSKRNGL